MLNFVTGPWVGVLVLSVLVLEAIGLGFLHSRTGHGPSTTELMPFLGAGFAFGVALVAALSFGGPRDGATVGQAAAIGLPLTAAFIFHVWDLKRRW